VGRGRRRQDCLPPRHRESEGEEGRRSSGKRQQGWVKLLVRHKGRQRTPHTRGAINVVQNSGTAATQGLGFKDRGWGALHAKRCTKSAPRQIQATRQGSSGGRRRSAGAPLCCTMSVSSASCGHCRVWPENAAAASQNAAHSSPVVGLRWRRRPPRDYHLANVTKRTAAAAPPHMITGSTAAAAAAPPHMITGSTAAARRSSCASRPRRRRRRWRP
jgi:hypothetical protein